MTRNDHLDGQLIDCLFYFEMEYIYVKAWSETGLWSPAEIPLYNMYKGFISVQTRPARKESNVPMPISS